MVEVILDGWFGLGARAEELEVKVAEYLGAQGCVLTNSGSSANFLVVAGLMSPLFKDRLHPGDEVITAACGFPTTVNPIIQQGLVPVFIDVNLGDYNINPADLEKALSPKTRAVFLAHTMGNPFDIDPVLEFCQKHNLFLIEDNCDALGSEYKGRKTGSFGILSTQSFYPPHHMTMGEGGMINYNDKVFERIIRSLRDWGRACYCRGDEKSTLGACKHRFDFKIDGKCIDHKYLFSQIGYNLKPIEPQAAMGVEQIKRLPDFTKKRKQNFKSMLERAKKWQKYFILPEATPGSDPSWFAFLLTIKDGALFDRHEITTYLEERMIQTRPLFAGNITRQPAYKDINSRVIGDLKNSSKIMHDTFFTGLYPGMEKDQITYISDTIDQFLSQY